jgi:transcriptional regulator with XRE-family HTH domain
MGIKETGDRVHMRRRALGLTQQQLAELCGFPYQIISRVEKGHQDLYAQRLALIAKHLRVSTDYLLGLTDRMEPVKAGQTSRKRVQAGATYDSELFPAAVASGWA